MTDHTKQILNAYLQCNEQCYDSLSSIAERFGDQKISSFVELIDSQLTNLNADEIAKLVRVFTRLEVCNFGYEGGSTSRVCGLICALRKLDPELADELEIWAFHTTNNKYVPFGTWGRFRDVAKTVGEYKRLTSMRKTEVNEAKE